MSLYRAASMQFALCVKVGSMRLFGRPEVPKINALTVYGYGRLEAMTTSADAKQPRFAVLVCALPVLGILLLRHFSQVANSVIRPITIYVVKAMRGPTAIVVEPGKAMSFVSAAHYLHVQIPLIIWGLARRLAHLNRGRNLLYAREESGFWAVGKTLFERIEGKDMISGSHFVAPLKQWIGERLGSVTSVVGPRCIIGEAR